MFLKNLLFGDNSNKTDYKQAAYDKYYRDITGNTYDRAFEGSKDFLDQNYEGGSEKYKYDLMNDLNSNYQNSLKNYNATKNDAFGNGLIGGFLNPIAQTMGSIGDLGGMALSGGKYNAWDASKDPMGVHRDIGSDLGALGETAITLGTMGHGMALGKAAKAAQAGTATAKQAALLAKSQIPKSIGQKVASGALMGAGYGATGNLRENGFENFDPSTFALSTAIGGGVGGGLAGLGGLLGKATTKKVAVTTGDAKPYQEALNNLKNNATGAMYSDVPTNLPTIGGPDLARVTLNNLDDDTLKTLYRTAARNTHPDKVAEGVGDSLFKSVNESNKLLQDLLKNGMPTTTTYETARAGNLGEALRNLVDNAKNSKAGTRVSSLLKTKAGKVGAGVGGGLLLAKLLAGQNGQPAQDSLSDEELMQLYNYYGGGQ